MKILLTGDIHLGKKYNGEDSEIAEKYNAARIKALKNAVDIANREDCDFFVIAGDLYESVTRIAVSLHKEVSRILDGFLGEAVLILPGNHDYYKDESDTLWKKFEESGTNTRVFKRNEKYRIGDTIFYPCICHDKLSKSNSLGWLSNEMERESEFYHIGIAHGAVEGWSYDKEGSHYFMSQDELSSLRMDAWLVGHAHVSYPAIVDNTTTQRIFNAGTPQQTDIGDNSASEVFVLEIDKEKCITAKKAKTGTIRFVKKDVVIQHGDRLRDALNFSDLDPESTSLRVNLSGVALMEDYKERGQVYNELGDTYLKAEIRDENLRGEITAEVIDKETMEGSLINQLLNLYLDDQELLNLAYELVNSCKGGR